MDIRLDAVRVVRSGRDVLTIPQLLVRQGCATAILGANGAGKTTLLRLVAGLERPAGGQVLVGGRPADVAHQHVAYAFQENVFLRRSLVDNLVLGLAFRGVPAREARERAVGALRLLGIEELAGRRADLISGGEARRATVARALSLGAPVLLLDEPMAGLDGTTYGRLFDELPALLSAARATTLLVTHQPAEAFRLCDDLVVLDKGRIIAAGAKGDVARRPGRADVAAALGYAVFVVEGRKVAVPAGQLQVEPRGGDITARVTAVFDLVHAWDVVVTVGQALVHAHLDRSSPPPAPGETVAMRARDRYDVS